MKLFFIDFETTGLIKQGEPLPEVIQAAIKIIDGEQSKTINEFYKASTPLSVVVRTETGITDKILIDKKPFADSNLLKEIVRRQNDYIQIAHNGIGFDFKVIENFGYKPKLFIDTLKLAKSLLDESDVEKLQGKFKLGYLRFLFEDKGYLSKEYVDKPMAFHTADYDVETLEQVFFGFFKLYQEKNPNLSEKEILTHFINISRAPILLSKINFGKNKDSKFEDLDAGYLKWLYENALADKNDEDLQFTVEHYLNLKNPSYFNKQYAKISPVGNVEIEKSLPKNVEIPKIDISDMPTPVFSGEKINDEGLNDINFDMN